MKTNLPFLLAGLSLLSSAAAFAAPLEISAVGPQTIQLGAQTRVELTVTAGAEFAGNVSVGVLRQELDAADPDQDVTAAVEPSTLTLAAGQSAKATLVLTTKTQARSFNAAKFQVFATGVASNNEIVAQALADAALSVTPVYEVKLRGGVPHLWESPAQTAIRKHADGVTVRFVNMDTADTHVIHGAGAIPHGDTARPLAKATATAPGGVYEIKFTRPQDNVRGVYYCHVHEDSRVQHQITFNYKP